MKACLLILVIASCGVCQAHDEDDHDHRHVRWTVNDRYPSVAQIIKRHQEIVEAQWKAEPYLYDSRVECEKQSIVQKMKAAYTLKPPKCETIWVRWPVDVNLNRTGPDQRLLKAPVFKRNKTIAVVAPSDTISHQ